MNRVYILLVAALMAGNSVMKMPFADSAVSGFDRPWMFQMQMRLWGATWVDFSAPFENAIVQIAAHHGQAELIPMFLTVGAYRLFGIPQTANNILWAYVALDAVVLLLVLALAKRLTGSAWAGLVAGAMYATYPMLVYVTMFPLQTNYTNLLVAAVVLLWIRYHHTKSRNAAVAAGVAGFVLLVSSRLAPLDAVFLLLLYAVEALWQYRDARGTTSAAAWIARFLKTPPSALLAGVIAGTAVDSLIYLISVVRRYRPFGIYQYFLDRAGGQEGGFLESVRYVGTTATYNGIFLFGVSLLLAAASPLLWRWASGRMSFARVVTYVWLAFYFVPPFFGRRWDYNEIYFIPMILLAVDVLRMLWVRTGVVWRGVVATAIVAGLATNVVWAYETVRNVPITGIPYRLSARFTAKPAEWSQFGVHPYYWIIGSLNADYHLKAAGYWMRKHTSPADSVVLLCGNVWHKMTAEYHFGAPFINISKPSRKRLFYLDDPRLKVITEADLDAERRDPHAFIRNKLLGEKFPLDGVTNAFVVVIHPLDVVKEAGAMSFVAGVVCGNEQRELLASKLFPVGRILNDRGEPEVSIFSLVERPFVEYREADAKRAFDEEFATWEHLWAGNIFGQMDSYFLGE